MPFSGEKKAKCYTVRAVLVWDIIQHLLNQVKEVLVVRILACDEFLDENKIIIYFKIMLNASVLKSIFPVSSYLQCLMGADKCLPLGFYSSQSSCP